MGDVASLAVSPDGRNVYLTSNYNHGLYIAGAGALAIFNRATNGDIAYASGITEDAPGCTPTPGNYALKYPYGVKVAPDGSSVYVASSEGYLSPVEYEHSVLPGELAAYPHCPPNRAKLSSTGFCCSAGAWARARK